MEKSQTKKQGKDWRKSWRRWKRAYFYLHLRPRSPISSLLIGYLPFHITRAHTVMTRQSSAFPANTKILVVTIAQDLMFTIVSPDCFQSQIWRQILPWHPQDILIGQSKTVDDLAFAMLAQEGGGVGTKAARLALYLCSRVPRDHLVVSSSPVQISCCFPLLKAKTHQNANAKLITFH